MIRTGDVDPLFRKNSSCSCINGGTVPKAIENSTFFSHLLVMVTLSLLQIMERSSMGCGSLLTKEPKHHQLAKSGWERRVILGWLVGLDVQNLLTSIYFIRFLVNKNVPWSIAFTDKIMCRIPAAHFNLIFYVMEIQVMDPWAGWLFNRHPLYNVKWLTMQINDLCYRLYTFPHEISSGYGVRVQLQIINAWLKQRKRCLPDLQRHKKFCIC